MHQVSIKCPGGGRFVKCTNKRRGLLLEVLQY